MKRLVLIDGKSVFYRGYYAMGALSLSDGTPTGGVYGFAAIAMEIVRKLKPTKVVVAWDSKTSTAKRKEIYPEYKAGRVKPGEDFYAQIPLLKELILDLGWEFVEIPEYEADDIIGSLSRQADETLDANGKCKYETYIISSDLDMLQIVDSNTHMWRILKGFSNIEKIDVAEVEQKYGIKKQQFLDMKALKGDASDNIPGVPGIGEKTAAKLLNEYGDLDNIYNNTGKISGTTRTKLEAGRDSAYMSRDLARIMFDAPVNLNELKDFVFNYDRVIAGLRKLEFNSLIRKVEANLAEVAKGSRDEELKNSDSGIIDGANSSITTGVDIGGGANDGGVTVGVSIDGETNDDSAATSVGIDDGPNGTMKNSGEKTRGAVRSEVVDDMIVDWNIKSLMHSDGNIAKQILEEGRKFWDLAQAKFLLNPLSREQPTLVTLDEVLDEQRREFSQYPKLYKVYTELDLPLIPILYKMEKKGMMVDREYFANLKTEYMREAENLEREVYALAGKEFNLNSPIQLSEVLFGDLALPTKGIKKTTRGYSTGAKELDKLKDLHPIIEKIIEYREVAKLLSTYVNPMPNLADAEGRIHTTFTQDVTATGRLSSHDPNLQNIPVRTEEGKRIRTGFVAPEGRVLVSADYSQFELRLAAILSGDQALIDDFNQGVDIHTKTASEAFGVPMNEVTKAQRRAAKVINFGILYGMSVKGLSDAAKMSIGEAKQFIDNYFRLRAPIKRKLESILEQAKNEGYVETFYGRRRPTPDVKSANFVIRQAAERAAQNMPIQGTEADLMKRAMIAVDKHLPDGADLVMQVHDSLIVECERKLKDEVAEILRSEMESVAPELAIKLAVEVTIGENWGEL